MRILRTIGIAGSATAILFSSTVAFAEDRPPIRPGMNQAGILRPMLASSTASTTRGAIKEIMHDRIETIREDARNRIEAVREEAQARIKVQREKTEQHLADIRDKAKQQMAERLAKQFDNINKTWTDHFMNVLDRLDAILKKVQDRANTTAGNGKDISSVTTAISSAQSAIAAARTAVTTQAGKTYALDPTIVPVTTSTTTPSGQEELMKGLRGAFKNLHTGLFKDLFALRDGPIKDARKAVEDAFKALRQIIGSDDEHATSTTGSNQ